MVPCSMMCINLHPLQAVPRAHGYPHQSKHSAKKVKEGRIWILLLQKELAMVVHACKLAL